MTIHGLRYARPGSVELVRYISEDLPYLDYDQTIQFYDYFAKAAKHSKDYGSSPPMTAISS